MLATGLSEVEVQLNKLFSDILLWVFTVLLYTVHFFAAFGRRTCLAHRHCGNREEGHGYHPSRAAMASDTLSWDRVLERGPGKRTTQQGVLLVPFDAIRDMLVH